MCYAKLLLPLLILLTVVPVQAQEKRPTTLAGRSTVYAPNGSIATSQPLATAAGLAVLQRGGNAVDAAVTAAAVLNLVEPHMTGIGGDMFALLWSEREQRLVGLNAAGSAGSLMTREELVARGHERMPAQGAESVTVPGALAGWAALLERYGTISLAEALAPAIELAEGGFPVSPIISRDWQGQESKLLRNAGAANTYLSDGTAAPQAGEWFRNPDLASSFRRIATEGPSALYGGELGQRIVENVQELGGFLTIDDLRRMEVEWVEPISAPFREYRLWELPPPGQGVAALQMLRILEDYDLKSMGHNSPTYLHHLIEAKKLAHADLAGHIADPAYMRGSVERLLTDEYIASRRALLDPRRAAEHVEPGAAFTESETIYLAASDAEGNMVSFINSIFGYFGSGVVVPGTGFALQNRGAGFTLEEGHPNTVAPGKRPFHTIIPAFVTRTTPDGEEPWLAFGVMGGSMQPQGHVQVLLNLVVFDMDLQDALDAARFRHLSGPRVVFEDPIGDEVRTALEAMGHEVLEERSDYGGAQAVMRLPRGWAASSDPRKDGHAAGH